MKQLLTSVTADNRKQTVQTLAGWVAWYRDILDEELVAAWRRDARANLPEVIMALSDDRVASDLVKFSWRESRQTTFNLAYAPHWRSACGYSFGHESRDCPRRGNRESQILGSAIGTEEERGRGHVHRDFVLSVHSLDRPGE
jgi:hypothetical protein